MATWIVYGHTWFAGEIEADTDEDAAYLLQEKLMNDFGIRFQVQAVEAELASA